MASRILRAIIAEIREFPATILLATIYVGLFTLMAISQGGLQLATHPLAFGGLSIQTLVDFGAIDKDRILVGHEYWRVVTATLLHGSIVHLLLNTIALYQLGRMIENWHGGGVLIFLHLVLGVAGSLASLWIHRMMPGRLVQVGGSGAIFGFCAFLMVANYFDDEEQSPRLFRALFWYLIIGLALGALMGADNAAHIGGAVAGAIIGSLDDFLRPNVLNKTVARALGIASLAVMAGSFAMGVRTLANQEQNRAERKMQAEKDALRRRGLAYRIRAASELMAIFQYADWAVAVRNPEPLPHRFQRADLLDQLANQFPGEPLAAVLKDVAQRLRIRREEEFLSKENLQRILNYRPEIAPK